MNTYENLSREELIQRIKVLETDIAQYAMKDAEIEKMNEKPSKSAKNKLSEHINEYYSFKIYLLQSL